MEKEFEKKLCPECNSEMKYFRESANSHVYVCYECEKTYTYDKAQNLLLHTDCMYGDVFASAKCYQNIVWHGLEDVNQDFLYIDMEVACQVELMDLIKSDAVI